MLYVQIDCEQSLFFFWQRYCTRNLSTRAGVTWNDLWIEHYTFFISGKIALNSFPLRKFTAVSFCKISLKVLLLRLLLSQYCLQLVATRDYFYCLQSHHRPVNYLSTAVQLTNRLLRLWADGWFVYHERVFSRLVSIPYCNNNVVVCNRAGWDKN